MNLKLFAYIISVLIILARKALSIIISFVSQHTLLSTHYKNWYNFIFYKNKDR